MLGKIIEAINETLAGDSRVREDNTVLKKQLAEQQWHHTRQNKRLTRQLVAARRRIAALERDLATARMQN